MDLLNENVGLVVFGGVGFLLIIMGKLFRMLDTKTVRIKGKKFGIIPYSFNIKNINRNVYVGGSTGAGKTVVINYFLKNIINREKKVKTFILDIKGDYEKAFGGKANVRVISHKEELIDFFDFGFIEKEEDRSFYTDEMANYLITADKEDFWTKSARAVFSELIIGEKIKNYNDFVEKVTDAKVLLKSYLKIAGTDESGQAARDVISTMTLGIAQIIKFMKGKKLVTLKEIIEDKKNEIIIIRSYPELYNVYNGLNTVYFFLLMNKILSLPDCPEDRFLFLLDEAGTLKTLSFVNNFLSLCRSKGAGCIVASQSLSQLGEYKDNILNNCNYKIIGRLNDLEDVTYFDDLIYTLTGEKRKLQNKADSKIFSSVGIQQDLNFFLIAHLDRKMIRTTKIDYMKI